MDDNPEPIPLNAEAALKALNVPGVIAVHPGERWTAGRPTGEAAIIALVDRKRPAAELDDDHDLGVLLAPHAVDVQQASPLQMMFSQPERYGLAASDLSLLEDRLGYPFPPQTKLFSTSLLALRTAVRPAGDYQPPPHASLGPLAGPMSIRCHASPDAGWAELKAFFGRIANELVVGMYDFTAPHIGDTLLAQMKPAPRVFHIAIDPNEPASNPIKANDRNEKDQVAIFAKALKQRFDQAWVAIGKGGTFPYAYHIKVAVRDVEEFWLSSGNWQSSNQPNLDPLGADAHDKSIDRYNREWHVIAHHPQLADKWKTYLLWDIETARQHHVTPKPAVSKDVAALSLFVPMPIFHYAQFFAPQAFDIDAASVTALLTPDNYIEAATALIDSAENSLLVQNQSLSFLKDEASQDPRYTAFIATLARKSRELADCKIMIRDPREFGGDLPGTIATYKAKGFDASKIRFQMGLHNKGFLVDGQKVLLGSHNITNSGLTDNRDASLIFDHAGITAYYQQFFDQDWQQAGLQPTPPDPIVAGPNDFAPPGMVRVSLSALLGS
jgi:hypothetical protein